MPVTVLVGMAAFGLALGMATWALLAGPNAVRTRALANLKRGLPAPARVADAAPQSSSLAAAARRLTPGASIRLLEKLHLRAGRPADWTIDKLLVAKPALAAASALVAYLLISAGAAPLFLLIATVTVAVAYFVPELLLYSRGIERSEKITLELADTLDQMTIAVEAGLGFDSAMARAGQNGKGPLAEELVRTLQDVQMGRSRRQAFEELAKRSDVPDLRRFVRAIIQADKHGIAIADVLRTQAGEMRLKRRQRAEEKAMQIPVKVIFPLMVCILPVLFIVLLGPAAMDIVAAFSS
ncbi:type II secretion system F family protein [Georgenia sp. SUBG003]|uniref:type II secretion system F family protein n=1 Tax=Georgenia sp. SUBG003 TaxID=1497974 RepID=UPI0004D8F1FE|nr:secretion system protein [Georgenia sp. SUBG003]